MENLFIHILPLALGSAVSPTLFTVALLILSNKNFPKLRAMAYVLGIIIVTVAIGVAGYFLTGLIVVKSSHKPSVIYAFIDLVLGLLLIFLAAKKATEKNKKTKPVQTDDSTKPKLNHFLLLGFIMMATNFTSIPLYLDEIKEIKQSNIIFFNQIIVFLFAAVAVLVPVLVPLLFYIVTPKNASKILQPISDGISKFGKYIVVAVFFVLGVYLSAKGLLVFY